jgi:hypothetical protein
MNQFVAMAVAEKVSALETARFSQTERPERISKLSTRLCAGAEGRRRAKGMN